MSRRREAEQLRYAAEEEVTKTLRRLPARLRERAQTLLVRYDEFVEPDLLATGIEPDTLGLFEGCAFADELYCEDALPSRIILFLANLWEEADGNEAIFREEVRKTYLHELGHFLGLTEDELADRDLE
jgi:predicted Zn-dependent protease with MMP-like domain